MRKVITLAGKPAYQIEYGIEKGDTSLMVQTGHISSIRTY